MAEHTKVYSVAALVSWYVRDARVGGLDERTLRQFVAWCEENGRPVEVAVPAAPRAVGEPSGTREAIVEECAKVCDALARECAADRSEAANAIGYAAEQIRKRAALGTPGETQ